MNLVDLETFARVAELGTLTAAAKSLGVPKSTVSRRVARLEDELGVALVHRASRSISLTDHGEHLWTRSSGALRELGEAERSLRDLNESPTGLLRLTAPADLGASRAISSMLARFRERWPAVRLEVDLSARVVDLVGEGFDVALRPVRPDASWSGDGLRMRVLGPLKAGIFASPALIERLGLPEHPSELVRYPWITHTAWARRDFSMVHAATGETATVPVDPVIRTNHIEQILHLVQADAGVGPVPWFLARRWASQGAIRCLLPGWELPAGRLGAVWPASRHLAPRVRAFIDFAAEDFARRRSASPAIPCEEGGS